MLEKAAADQWGVDPSAVKARDHAVHHAASGRSIGYGDLVERASTLPVPPPEGPERGQGPRPRGPSRRLGALDRLWRSRRARQHPPGAAAGGRQAQGPQGLKYIGKPVPIYDLPDMTHGKAVYGIDVRLPGMKYAAIQRPPVLRGTIKSYDA